MSNSELKYRESLERLLNNRGVYVKGSYEINLDTIAIESGLKRGSIRKNRLSEQFLREILIASGNNKKFQSSTPESKLRKLKSKYSNLKAANKKLSIQYEESIAREMNLAYELMSIKQELVDKSPKVVKFNPVKGKFED